MKPYISLFWSFRKIESKLRRYYAQRKLEKAVACGIIKKPLHCERCQRRTIKRKLQGHHRDYRYPLKVIWLCQSCHVKAQGRRAIERAAFYVELRERRRRLYAKEEKLKKRYKAGQLSRRRYYKLRRELYAKNV